MGPAPPTTTTTTHTHTPPPTPRARLPPAPCLAAGAESLSVRVLVGRSAVTGFRVTPNHGTYLPPACHPSPASTRALISAGLERLGRVSTGGPSAAHCAVHSSGKFLAVAHHGLPPKIVRHSPTPANGHRVTSASGV